MGLRFLRLFLGMAALTWGVSILGLVLSWPLAHRALQWLGAQPIAYDPMLDYWLRMTSGAFTLLGGWYLVLMIWPSRYYGALPWFGVLMLAEGVILLVHGLRLSLPAFPFYADAAACLVSGIGILSLFRHARPSA